MKIKFSPCTGECTEEGTKCEGCARSHEEIAEMKTNIGSLTVFADSVAGSIKYKMGAGH